MKPNDDSSVEKLTVENKNQVLEAVVDDMTKHDVVYVAIKEITDAEGTTTITQPKDDDIFDGAKSMIEMEGKVKKPSDDQVEHRIKKDLAAAKMLIRKYVQKVDQPKMKRAAGSAPSAMYEWMTEYGKEGDASRLGHLADKLRAIKMTSSKYQNMRVYLAKMLSLWQSMEDIKAGYLPLTQFLSLVLANMGKTNRSMQGPYRWIYKQLAASNLKGDLTWDTLEAELHDAWDQEQDDSDDEDAADKEPAKKEQPADDIALIAREAVREYVHYTSQQVGRGGKGGGRGGHRTGDGRKGKGGKGGKGGKDAWFNGKICYKFRDTGSCNFGDNCRFEHGQGGAKTHGGKRNQRDEWSASSGDEEPRNKRRKGHGEAVFMAREGATVSTASPKEILCEIGSHLVSVFPLLWALFKTTFCAAFGCLRRKAGQKFSAAAACVPAPERVSEYVYNTMINGVHMIVDNGATCHIVNSKAAFRKMRNKRKGGGQQVSMNGHLETIAYRGDLDLEVRCFKTGATATITCFNVAYVPTSGEQLFSTPAYLKSHHENKPAKAPENSMVQTHDDLYISAGSGEGAKVLHGQANGNLWFLNIAFQGLDDETAAPVTDETAATSSFSATLLNKLKLPLRKQ
jgi:hypothetical protein